MHLRVSLVQSSTCGLLKYYRSQEKVQRGTIQTRFHVELKLGRVDLKSKGGTGILPNIFGIKWVGCSHLDPCSLVY